MARYINGKRSAARDEAGNDEKERVDPLDGNVCVT